MTRKKQKYSKKEIVGLGLLAVVYYIYSRLIWTLIIGGSIVAVVAFFFVDGTAWDKLIVFGFGIVIAGISLILARLLDKNIWNTTPPGFQ